MSAKAYTFYSYKGGSGRTTTAVNTVKHLADVMGANSKNPILLVDADLESAGLTYFFNCEMRFTSLFDDSIHTNKIFGGESSFDCDNANGRRLFGIANEETDIIAEATRRKLLEISEKSNIAITEEGINTLFSDLYLTLKKCSMFKRIIEAVYWDVFPEKENGNKAEIYCNILNLYNKDSVLKLVKKLIAINREDISNKEKKEKKAYVINAFLPAVEFVDVSAYFDFPYGTVKFLGVDIRFNEEQILRNGSEQTILKFLEVCGEQNYAAVIFDSGAGVQSSAHILHSVSDVLVYCMRPAVQFLKGTIQQLKHYERLLRELHELKSDPKKKPVILLPTAVPSSKDDDFLCSLNFNKILTEVNLYTDFVDTFFCLNQGKESLKEVELFKWNECILGTSCHLNDEKSSFSNEALAKHLSVYADVDTMPEDAKQAYRTYRKLAEKLVKNT